MDRKFPALVVASALLWCAGPSLAGPAPVPEYQLKAAFVVGFIPYVTWPETPGASGSFQIGVLGPEEVAESVRAIARGKVIGGEAIAVRRLGSPSEVPGCRVLLLTGAPPAQVTAALDSAARHGVLTVGENSSFLKDGGMIRLKLVGRRVRFDVNPSAAEKSGLSLRAQLLQIADQVVGARVTP